MVPDGVVDESEFFAWVVCRETRFLSEAKFHCSLLSTSTSLSSELRRAELPGISVGVVIILTRRCEGTRLVLEVLLGSL